MIRCHVELICILCLMNSYISPYYPGIASKLLDHFLLKREPAILNLIIVHLKYKNMALGIL